MFLDEFDHIIKISIHALREEGDARTFSTVSVAGLISIHALREEGDSSSRRSSKSQRNFYPRPPQGGRRRCNIL